MTYRAADRVISTNQSYRASPSSAAPCHPRVHGRAERPRHAAMRPVVPRRTLAWRVHLLVYLGIMGPQDGVDLLARRHGRAGHGAAATTSGSPLLGFGDWLEDLQARDAASWISSSGSTFTGPSRTRRSASTSAPRRRSVAGPEDSAQRRFDHEQDHGVHGLRRAVGDLRPEETRVSAGDSALYVDDGDIGAFTDAVEALLNDPAMRVDLGRRARARVTEALDWRPQAAAYVDTFDSVTHHRREGTTEFVAPTVAREDVEYIDVDDPATFTAFLHGRHRPERSAHADSPAAS